ncbi:MAG TPA: DUF3137 domain-containing protein [Pararhizobium sp.]|uniref:DUF3137 domain-containing protein n=1 Tax=Pararhizobium sp. TaxID=1977563 RepID=UPI002B82F5D3|nr:DUF3137 domain-containing protein [Pararhizobium sp.]HTO32461.1 DUF3137 domain-containing protein [Pararhizobium sp.]
MSDQAFDEARVVPDEAALVALRTAIGDYNDARPRLERAMEWRLTVVMGVYAVAAVTVFFMLVNEIGWGEGLGAVVAILFGIGWGLYNVCMKPVRDFQQNLRNRMLPLIFGFVEEMRYTKGLVPRFMEKFPKWALLKYGVAEHDDAISGQYDGMHFMLSEAELKTGGKNKTTLFDGVIFHFYLDRPFPGILAAAKRPTGMQKFAQELFGTGDLRIIESHDPTIDATHEFRTDNTMAARPLIEGPLVKALDYLSDVWRDDVVRIALSNHECFLLVPTKRNFFELPDIAHDIDFDRHVSPMIRDLVTLLVTARLVSRIGMEEAAKAQHDAGAN